MFRNLHNGYENILHTYLSNLYKNAPEVQIDEGSPLIIFSDLHMGNGKKSDDFRKNGELFTETLKEHYLANNYTLVLNGDIEELQKFEMHAIEEYWAETFSVFSEFAAKDRLYKIIGNHDDGLRTASSELRFDEKQAVIFKVPTSDVPIFVFHGHQASIYYRYLNRLNTLLLRYIVNPIGIKNFSKKFKHQKKMRIEHRSYRFSRNNKLISIIGHTHRPLFESVSRADSLHFTIEHLLRKYRKANDRKRLLIAARIKELKRKYDQCINSKPDYEPTSLMYSRGIPVPCLFNTGCAIGKRGITGIEITSKTISLVHWFDSRVSSRFLFDSELNPEPLKQNPSIHRVVLRKDNFDYISDSINLLGDSNA